MRVNNAVVRVVTHQTPFPDYWSIIHYPLFTGARPNNIYKPVQVLTLAKTCERVDSIRVCERNRDWSILALQNIRWISRNIYNIYDMY